jgi:hypothetical protein
MHNLTRDSKPDPDLSSLHRHVITDERIPLGDVHLVNPENGQVTRFVNLNRECGQGLPGACLLGLGHPGDCLVEPEPGRYQIIERGTGRVLREL